MDPPFRNRNRAAIAQLRAFVNRLQATDLDRPLGDGWTVKAALVHLAFWDRLAASLLEDWERTGVRPVLANGEDLHINRVCLADWLAVPAEYALQNVIEAAALADQRAGQVDEQLFAAIVSAGESWACLRYTHRSEHLAQMEQAFLREA